MALQGEALQYFSSMNSMANRLCVDLTEAMLTNKEKLNSLSFEEQQQLLYDEIVTPQVLMKYPQEEECCESPTKYAVKMIVDDHYSYRDEHSGPFSFHTASQRDLSCITRKKTIKKITPKYCTKAAPVKSVISTQGDEEILISEQIELKLESDVEEEIDDSNGHTSLIPKTGLDLLDNW